MSENKEVIADTKKYELTCFLSSESTESVLGVLSAIRIDAALLRPIEKISLAYPINKQRQAFMGVFQFEASPLIIPKISRELGLRQDVMRSIVIAVPRISEDQGSSRDQSAALASKRAGRSSLSTETRKTADAGVLTNEDLEQQIRSISQ